MTALKIYRKGLGLSQRTLARRAGLSFRTVQLLEAGGRDFRWSTLVHLAQVLGLNAPELLLPGSKPGNPLTAAETARSMAKSGQTSWKLWLFDFVDAFRLHTKPGMVAEPPPADVPPRILALLASTVESLCSEHRLPTPWWCAGVPPLIRPWFVAGVENLKASALVEAPASFRRRNIFVLGNFLSRA